MLTLDLERSSLAGRFGEILAIHLVVWTMVLYSKDNGAQLVVLAIVRDSLPNNFHISTSPLSRHNTLHQDTLLF